MSSGYVFDKYAWRYDLWYVRNREIFECELRAVKALGLSGVGLDVGVGTGIFSAKIGVRVGVDPSIGMLKIAKDRGVDVVRAVGENLPFRSEIFNYVIMIVTLCFLDKPKVSFKEIWRILKKHGFLASCVVPKDSLWGEFYIKKAEQGHIFYRRAHFYTVEEIEKMLEECMFRVTEYKATLSYDPCDKPCVEDPVNEVSGKGFVCVKAIKIHNNPHIVRGDDKNVWAI